MLNLNIISLIIGAVFSAVATVSLIIILKPKICFDLSYIKEEEKGKVIKIPVENLNKHFAAVNLRIEAAVVFKDKTYHFNLDRQDFIMLSKNTGKRDETPYKRTYQAVDIADFTKKITKCEDIDDLIHILTQKDAYLRVRIHAYHEFTGFGKAFEGKFKFEPNSFLPINELKHVCKSVHVIR